MSALALAQTYTAIGPNLTSSFLATGGTPPYVYSVQAGGAGGTIDSASGLYTAPARANSNPAQAYDVISVADSASSITRSNILVGTALFLFCDILQTELGLPNDHIYVWDQKIMQPTDAGLYIAVAVLSCKPFGNTNQMDGSGQSVQSVNMYARLQIDAISRGPDARDRKEEIIAALNSNYAQSQQEANSFYIGKLPPGAQFINLSNPDGAAIPYRFNIAVALQYFVKTTKAVPYYDTFSNAVVMTEP